MHALTALLVGSSSGLAMAQTVTLPVPPIRSPVDERGVNLATGKVDLSSTDVTIGDDQNGLAFTRYWVETGWRHGYMASMTADATSAKVTIGDNLRTFDRTGNTFTSKQQEGETLAVSGSNFTYTSADGTQYVFTEVINNASYYGSVSAIATSITWPTGDKLTLDYKETSYELVVATIPETVTQTMFIRRLQSVRNSSGLQLKFSYATNATPTDFDTADEWSRITGVTGINNAVDYCDPTADSCSTSQSWPSASYVRSDGDKETVVDALSRSTRYTTAGYEGRMLAIRSPRSSFSDTTIYGYTDNKVSSVSNGQASWTYGWAGTTAAPVVTITDPLNHTNVVTTNSDQGVVTQVKDALNRTTSYAYYGDGRLQAQLMPGSGSIHYHRDDRGNNSWTLRLNEAGAQPISTYADYPSSCSPTTMVICNKPTATRDAAGNQTDYEYSPVHGGVVRITRPAPAAGQARPETRFTYEQKSAYYKNASGSLVAGPAVWRLTGTASCITGGTSCAGTANELKTTISYGAPSQANNLYPTAVSTGAGNGSLTATVGYGYDAVGNRTSVDGPLPGAADTSTMFYDAARQLVQAVSPDPDGTGALQRRAVKYERNQDGQVEIVRTGTADASGTIFTELQRAETTYDVLGRKTLDQMIMGGVGYGFTQYSYDAANRAVCTAQRMNRAAFGGQADACQQGTAGGDGPDRISRTNYFADDQVSTVENGLGTGLAQTTQAITYDPTSGKVASVADARGNTTWYEYDAYGRPSITRYATPSSGTTPSSTDYEQLTYAADGRSLVTGLRTRDSQTIGLNYDALGRLTFRNLPGLYEMDVTYGYDNLDRLVSATGEVFESEGSQITLNRDALGRLVKEINPQGDLRYTYDLAGRRTELIWMNGSTDGFTINYDYLVTGELDKVRENGATSGVGLLASYSYDDLGRRTGLNRSNNTSTSWSYGTSPWLTGLTQELPGTASDLTRGFTQRSVIGEIRQVTSSNPAYAHGGYANVSRGYSTADALNRYPGNTGATFGYDGRGNLTSSTNTATGAMTLYSYRSDNRLMVGNGAGFRYDALDRMYRLNASGTTLRYGSDGELIGEQSTATNAWLRRYAHGQAADEPLVWYEGAGAGDRRWFHADERGSVVAVSDGAGNAITKLTYDEHGIPSPTNADVRFQYTGQTWLAEIGAYNYKARIYSPTLGRFLQTDPIGIADHMNMYAYTGGDPVNKTDPSGLAVPRPGGCPAPEEGGAVVCGEKYTGYTPSSLFIKNGYSPAAGLADECRPAGRFNLGARICGPGEGDSEENEVTVYATPQKKQITGGRRTTICERRDWHELQVAGKVAALRAAGWAIATSVRFQQRGSLPSDYAVADYIARGPAGTPFRNTYYFGEVKTGNADLTGQQRKHYQTGLVTILSSNASGIGLDKGDVIPVVWPGYPERFPGCPAR